LFQGKDDDGAAAAAEAFGVALRAADPAALRRLVEVHVIGAIALPGGVDRLERACREGGARVGDDLAFRTALAEQWAIVHSYRGRMRQALAAADRALAMAQTFGGLPLWRHWTARLLRVSLGLSFGERPPLEPLVAEVFALAEANPNVVIGFAYSLAQAAWLEDDAEPMRHVARRIDDLPRTGNHFEAMWRPLLAAKLALVDGDRATGLRRLRVCAGVESASPLFNILGSARAVLAGVLLDAG